MEITERFPQELGNLAHNARFPHSHKPIPFGLEGEERRMNRPQGGSLSERRTGLLSERRAHLEPLWNHMLLRVSGLLAKGTLPSAPVCGILAALRHPHPSSNDCAEPRRVSVSVGADGSSARLAGQAVNDRFKFRP